MLREMTTFCSSFFKNSFQSPTRSVLIHHWQEDSWHLDKTGISNEWNFESVKKRKSWELRILSVIIQGDSWIKWIILYIYRTNIIDQLSEARMMMLLRLWLLDLLSEPIFSRPKHKAVFVFIFNVDVNSRASRLTPGIQIRTLLSVLSPE